MSDGPTGARNRVEVAAYAQGETPSGGRGSAPNLNNLPPRGKASGLPARKAGWVNQLIDREIKAGRLKVTSAQRSRLAKQMQDLSPDNLQRLVLSDASQPLVRQLEVLAQAEGERPGQSKKNVVDKVLGTLSNWNRATGQDVKNVSAALGGPGGESPNQALRSVEDRARTAGVHPVGEAASPQLGGAPGSARVADVTAPANLPPDQVEHLTVVHHVPGNNPGELRKESQSVIADEAEQKLRAGQELSQLEVEALKSQGRLGLNPGSSPSAASQAQFAGTGIITGYEPVPAPTSDRDIHYHAPTPPTAGGDIVAGRRAVVKTAGQLLDELIDKSPAEIKALQKKLAAAGTYGNVTASGYIDQATTDAYRALLQETATYQTHFKDLTPDELLDKKLAGINAAGGKTSTTRNTNTTVSLTDPITAKGYLIGSMKSMLGRMPSAGEINNFVNTLNQFETANPSVTSSTTTSTQSGSDTNTNTSSNTSSTQSGGLGSPADFGDSFIMQNNMPEVRSSNAVQFYQLALDALKSPVSVSQQ